MLKTLIVASWAAAGVVWCRWLGIDPQLAAAVLHDASSGMWTSHHMISHAINDGESQWRRLIKRIAG